MYLQFLSVLLLVLHGLSATQDPNVCKTFEDYHYDMKTNPNCWYNPDFSANASTLAHNHGYPFESHKVATEDGYVLTLFRIPRLKGKGVILLQHPAFSSGTMWIDKGNSSLGFQLYDAGYDVWISNSRGTGYSRGHLRMTDQDPKFWDFSYHEMALYDVPAQLAKIDQITKGATSNIASNLASDLSFDVPSDISDDVPSDISDDVASKSDVSFNKYSPNIAYVGHSLGGTLSVLYPTLHPEQAKKFLKVAVAACPGSQMKYVNHPLWPIIMSNSDTLTFLAKTLNVNFILEGNLREIFKSFCSEYISGIELCADLVYFAMGSLSWKDQMKPEWYPIVFSQNPSGISTKVLFHYMQNGLAGKFQPWDYGKEGNLLKYNSTEPPLYRVENVNVPMLFISGELDNVVPKEDTQEIWERVGEEAKKYGHYVFPGFNHFDFVYGKNIDRFNRQTIKFLNKVFKE